MYNMNHVDQIAERFGDVSTLYLGNQPSILLSGYKTFKEAFVEQADIFTDRPRFPVNDKLTKGKGTDGETII